MVRKGQDFLFPTSGFDGDENKEITITDVDRGDNETTVDLDKRASGLGAETSVDDLSSRIDPREVQQNRSPQARNADRGQDAPLTTDPLEWASDPAGHDFPGVDSGPAFRDEQGSDFDTDAFVEDTVDIDDTDDRLDDFGIDI